MPRKCSFCNEVENPQRRILANENDDAFICEYCVEGAYSIIYGEEKVNLKSQNMNMALILKILPQKN